MKIAVIAHRVKPLVRPDDGAGQMAYWAALAMQRAGHDVTLFAPEGSEWEGDLVTTGPPDARRVAERMIVPFVARYKNKFDIFWDHTHTHPVCRFMPELPFLNHAHDREAGQRDVDRVVAVSMNQAMDIGNAQWIVKNGIDLDAFPLYTSGRDDYILWMGSADRPHKGFVTAQRAARKAGVELKAVGPGTEHGVVWGEEKVELLQRARALLFTATIECGPLTVLEAQACGTPVVALWSGGTPEYVAVPGFLGREDELPKILQLVWEEKIDYIYVREYVEGEHSLPTFARRMERVLAIVAGHRIDTK